MIVPDSGRNRSANRPLRGRLTESIAMTMREKDQAGSGLN